LGPVAAGLRVGPAEAQVGLELAELDQALDLHRRDHRSLHQPPAGEGPGELGLAAGELQVAVDLDLVQRRLQEEVERFGQVHRLAPQRVVVVVGDDQSALPLAEDVELDHVHADLDCRVKALCGVAGDDRVGSLVTDAPIRGNAVPPPLFVCRLGRHERITLDDATTVGADRPR
jgi:hypothetical protein